ncbi:MAG: hypothetical protein QNJ74_29630 [Trichodesmium sp. MO_231.B1]|nr:hypothetical protein [Trichodesmium sp. MO_231.B1]
MDKKDIRSRAAKKFMDNFETQLNLALQETQIEENNSELANTNKKSKEHQSDKQCNLSELEEAIADIDKYIQTNKEHSP